MLARRDGEHLLVALLVLWLKEGDRGIWPDPLKRAVRAAAREASQSMRGEPKRADATGRVPETTDYTPK